MVKGKASLVNPEISQPVGQRKPPRARAIRSVSAPIPPPTAPAPPRLNIQCISVLSVSFFLGGEGGGLSCVTQA